MITHATALNSPASAYARVQRETAPKPPADAALREKNYSLRVGRLRLEYSSREPYQNPDAGQKIPPADRDFTRTFKAASEDKKILFSLRSHEPGSPAVSRPAACRAYAAQEKAPLGANRHMLSFFV
jgi:hypothetical protein